MFSFNEGLDRAVIKPVAKGYDAIVPTPINNIVTNFFGNIDDLMIAVNNLLQGKFKASASDLGRVALNSTLGIGGLIDVATGMTLEKHEEDFGQTFARWGFGQGAYVVLPVFGRCTVLDTFGLAADVPLSPISWVSPDVVKFSATGVRLIDARADLLSAEKVVDAGAIDKYSYMRDAYLQWRQYLIYDGNPPREEEDY
jgi:phospholipid-binding lipoprotein MlaA